MTFQIVLKPCIAKQLMEYPLDTRKKIVTKIRECLSDNPEWDSTKPCNKKGIKGSKKQVHMLHISMTWTVFYVIDKGENLVIITGVMGINQAHKFYHERITNRSIVPQRYPLDGRGTEYTTGL